MTTRIAKQSRQPAHLPAVELVTTDGEVVSVSRGIGSLPVSVSVALRQGSSAVVTKRASGQATPVLEPGAVLADRREFFASSKSFPGAGGVLVLRQKDGGAWSASYAKTLLPYVLGKEAVESGWMPPDGKSALPSSLAEVVPPDLRYWEAVGPDARVRRDKLVASNFMEERLLKVVDGQIRLCVERLFLYEPGAETTTTKRDVGPLSTVMLAAGTRHAAQPLEGEVWRDALRAVSERPDVLAFLPVGEDTASLSDVVKELACAPPVGPWLVAASADMPTRKALTALGGIVFSLSSETGSLFCASYEPPAFACVLSKALPKAGAFVSWASANGTGYGRIVRVYTEGTVPDVDGEPTSASADDPAARVEVWAEQGGAWSATDAHVAQKLAVLSEVEPLADVAQPDVPVQTEKGDYSSIVWTPPKAVTLCCKQGLASHALGHSDPLTSPDTLAWAAHLASGGPISVEKARAVLARPRGRTCAAKSMRATTDALWGGEAAQVWCKKLLGQVQAADTRKATWTTAQINALPDSAFLYIAPGGTKDDGDDTTPRALRYFPVRNAAGDIDLPHLRNALARLSFANLSDEVRASVRAEAERLLAQANETAKADDEPQKVVAYSGITIHVDRPKGFVQHGTAPDGTAWERVYQCDYGYIEGTQGGDDEALDVFIGETEGVEVAYVVEQVKDDGTMDEFKLLLGFADEAAARAMYLAHVPEKFLKALYPVSLEFVKGLVGVAPFTDAVKRLVGVLKRDVRAVRKADAEERYVLGIVLEPETLDAQNDVYSAEEIRKTAHKFMSDYQTIGLMHEGAVGEKVKVLESWLAPDDMTVGETPIKKGTWLMAVRVSDDTLWEAVKKGELTGFSIGGTARRVPVEASNG